MKIRKVSKTKLIMTPILFIIFKVQYSRFIKVSLCFLELGG